MFDTFLHYGYIALAVYKTLAVVVTVLAIVGIAFVASKSGELRRRHEMERAMAEKKGDGFGGDREMPSEYTLGQLQETTIKQWRLVSEKEDIKAALIEADALVDAALRVSGFSGETMADRMRAIPIGRVSNLENLWKAHRVRNNIAHDPHYHVSPREGHDMMQIYKKTLEELGAL
ncbi:MAG: hypothetical protein G01um101470_565 [Parcubacteria group bacterium Gr01-1014_70]|nr:MAG: hypothetical protein G01um101470_565 [Parcubacteria group bacterium Gr01-1014_70]